MGKMLREQAEAGVKDLAGAARRDIAAMHQMPEFKGRSIELAFAKDERRQEFVTRLNQLFAEAEVRDDKGRRVRVESVWGYGKGTENPPSLWCIEFLVREPSLEVVGIPEEYRQDVSLSLSSFPSSQIAAAAAAAIKLIRASREIGGSAS